MPIYEYLCKNCGNRFEKLQPLTDDPIRICPNCGEEKVRRVIHPAGIIFKGSGWYKNDSRKPEPSESSPDKGASDSGSTAEKAAENKPGETKSEGSTSEKSSAAKDSGSDSKVEGNKK